MIFTLTAPGEDARALAGDWLVRAAGQGEWRTVAELGLDESGWQATSTPGRWWLDPGLADESAVLYRRHFELPPDLAAELGGAEHDHTHRDTHGDTHRDTHGDARWWLVASGLCELGHLWFDGTYLGDLRGRHAQHAFEVDGLLRHSREHLAAVEAAHGTARVPEDHDAQVKIQRTGPARIQRVRALVIEASPDRAVLRVAGTVDSSGTHRAEVTTTVLSVDDPSAGWSRDPTRQVARLDNGMSLSEPILARGRNDLEWLVAVEQPSLWWPAGMGDQAQYCIDIDVAVDGCSSHAVRLLTGIRTVTMRGDGLFVNGESCGGGPAEAAVALDGLAHRSVYEGADAAGTLLCQQVPLSPTAFAGAERSLRALGARAAAAAADHAGHHPSVVSWQLDPPRTAPRPTLLRGRWTGRVLRQAMTAADPTRPQTKRGPDAS